MSSILRQKMKEDLQLCNYSEVTIKNYLQFVAHFAKYFGKSPDKLGPEHVREYQLHLLKRNVSWSTFNGHAAALRFFFQKTLKRAWMVERIRFGKREKKLPVVLTIDEVKRVIEHSDRHFRVLFITLYSTGMRLNEASSLQIQHIDAHQKVIHIIQSKGKKDRNIPLNEHLYRLLKKHWATHRNPKWIFPCYRTGEPFCHSTIQKAFRKAKRAAGLKKNVTPKTLRHCFATHLLEAGTDIRVIQKLLGHACIKTTLIYAHVTTQALDLAVCPIMNLESSI